MPHDRLRIGFGLAALAAGVIACDRVEPAPTRLTFVSIAAGGHHTCGVDSTATTWCWGDNSSGQLGNGGTTSGSRPTRVTSGVSFITVSAGFAHTCGITIAYVAYCWGANESGQLGDSTTTPRWTPVRVATSAEISGVSAGFTHTCGVTPGGVTLCWGDNSAGQLGDGTTAPRLFPVVAAGVTLERVSAGGAHTCGISLGFNPNVTPYEAYCWGSNEFGQIGDGTDSTRLRPVLVPGITFVTEVVAGQYHTCGFTDGASRARCWGDNSAGQLGDGTTTPASTPVLVQGNLSASPAGAGGLFTCVLAASAETMCWGENSDGQLGDGTTSGRLSPVPVLGSREFSRLSAGLNHTCAIVNRLQQIGPAYCWGDNSAGQLGDGTTTDRLSPVRVEP